MPNSRKQIQLKRVAAGSYTAFVNGREKRIHRNEDRATSWFGQWIITDPNDPHSYSDPIPTLKDCINALASQSA